MVQFQLANKSSLPSVGAPPTTSNVSNLEFPSEENVERISSFYKKWIEENKHQVYTRRSKYLTTVRVEEFFQACAEEDVHLQQQIPFLDETDKMRIYLKLRKLYTPDTASTTGESITITKAKEACRKPPSGTLGNGIEAGVGGGACI